MGRGAGSRGGKSLAAFCLAWLALLLCGGAATAVGREVPGYQGYVNDYAAMLSAETRTRLERELQAFDRSDSTQVAILTIDSLEGDSLEEFSIRVVEQWRIGQQGKDNGVLFLAVKNDRRMRIEVGRGLEHVLTDLAAGRIIDGVVTPRFKAGRFDEGFEAGTLAIIQTVRGEYTPEPGRRGQGGGEPPLFFKYLFFGLAFIAFLGSASRPLGIVAGAVLLPLMAAVGLPGAIGWVLLLLLIVVGGVAGLVLPLMLSGMISHSRSGGYYTGGYGGGGSFGGGGFGGFGGGSFGGGGASGSW